MSAIVNKVIIDEAFGASIVNLLSSSQTKWGIYATGTSTPVIQPDGFYKIHFNDDSRTSDYPVELGGFASYNKVMVPKSVHLILLCRGSGNMSRADFLATIQGMKASVDIYDIATPDYLYTSMVLTRYNYKREATDGVTLLTVEAIFEEVRQAPAQTYSNSNGNVTTSDSVSAATPQNIGSPQAGEPLQIGPLVFLPSEAAPIKFDANGNQI